MTHMAPEVMLLGKLSRGSDVYAFGVLLWELFTACRCGWWLLGVAEGSRVFG